MWSNRNETILIYRKFSWNAISKCDVSLILTDTVVRRIEGAGGRIKEGEEERRSG